MAKTKKAAAKQTAKQAALVRKGVPKKAAARIAGKTKKK